MLAMTISVRDTGFSSASRYLPAYLPPVDLEQSYVADVLVLLLCFLVFYQATVQ